MLPAPSFTDEVLPILRAWLVPVIDGLRAGIGDDGMPRGDLGARLSGFPSFEPDASRRLVVRARRRPLIELRTELARLLEMVDYALVNGLWIAMTGR